MDCLFCKIAKNEIPANIVYRDDTILAFNDISPQAPQHVVIIPHKHIATTNELHDEDNELVGHMVQSAARIASQLKLADDGYRLVMNCNPKGGQTIYHIHLHLLGGRQMIWPPG